MTEGKTVMFLQSKWRGELCVGRNRDCRNGASLNLRFGRGRQLFVRASRKGKKNSEYKSYQCRASQLGTIRKKHTDHPLHLDFAKRAGEHASRCSGGDKRRVACHDYNSPSVLRMQLQNCNIFWFCRLAQMFAFRFVDVWYWLLQTCNQISSKNYRLVMVVTKL